MKFILSVKLNLQPAWLWWIDFQRRCLCHLCRLFWLPNSQRWSKHVQFTGCHGNCLHTSDASGDWLHVFYIHCILFGKYTKSLRNSLKRSRKIDVSIVNLHWPCQWLLSCTSHTELLGQFPPGVFYSNRIIHFCCLPRRGLCFKVPEMWSNGDRVSISKVSS